MFESGFPGMRQGNKRSPPPNWLHVTQPRNAVIVALAHATVALPPDEAASSDNANRNALRANCNPTDSVRYWRFALRRKTPD